MRAAPLIRRVDCCAELYAHLNKEHYKCHVCSRTGANPYRYYDKYPDLVCDRPAGAAALSAVLT